MHVLRMAEQDCATTGKELGRDISPELTMNKCVRGSPTLCTPYRSQKRVLLRELANHEADHEAMERLAPRRLVSSVSSLTNTVIKTKSSSAESSSSAILIPKYAINCYKFWWRLYCFRPPLMLASVWKI